METPKNPPQTNLDRLLTHLPEGSLAAKFAAAFIAPGDEGVAKALAGVTGDRINELRRMHVPPENHEG